MVKVGFTAGSDRLASLREYRILDTEAEAIFDCLTQLAAFTCETPIAAIGLIDGQRMWFKSAIGLDVREMPLQETICLINSSKLIISDTLADFRTNNLAIVKHDPKIRFYAGVPLISVEGHILGSLWVADNRARQISDRQIAFLEIASERAIEILESQRQSILLRNKEAEKQATAADTSEIDRAYKAITQAMPQGAIFLSNQRVICNSKAEKILGRGSQEVQTFLLLEPCWQAVSEDNIPLTIDTHPAWITLMSGKSLAQIGMGIPKPDGKISWVKVDTHPVSLDNSNRLLASGVLCSLTEVPITKPAIAEDREYLSLSSDLLCIFNRDGYLKQLLNTAWETTLGYKPEELLNKHLLEFVRLEDRASTLTELTQIANSTGVREFSNRWLCQDGSSKWISWNTVPIPDSNLVYGIGRDLTESRLLQASIQELDNINLALERAAIVAIVEPNGWIKHANHKLCELSTFALDELIGKPLSFLSSGEQDEQFFPQIWAKLNRGEIWKGEIKCKAQDGTYFWVDMTIVPLADVQGSPIHYVAIGSDITDKKQLEKQFLHAQRLESIGTMAGGISHDLNNILTPILAASQLLQMKFPEADSRTKQLLKTLEINSKRGASLVKQVLSFARGLEGVKTALTVKHIITEIQQIINQTFPKNIEIVAEIPTDLWMVMGDATQIHQVLMNLTVNARDAMADGGTLTIGAENITLDSEYARLNLDAKVGPYVSIWVMDNGMGIPSEIIDRIFDPFFTTKDLAQGTGLGLATVLTIIKGHQGFIKVDSKLGKGSLFKVYLPAIVSADERVIIEPRLPLGKGELILVVDDENMIVETTKTTLETYNYRVLIASDGIDAIAIYAQRKHEISAVILDVMMPIMDGSQTIRVLRRLNPLVKIITTSGLQGCNSRYHINSNETFLPKPYTPRDLLESLTQILHKNL